MAKSPIGEWTALRDGKPEVVDSIKVGALQELHLTKTEAGVGSRIDAEFLFRYRPDANIRIRIEGIRSLELPSSGYGSMEITELLYDGRADYGWEQGRHHLWDECGGFRVEFDRFVETVIE